MMNIIEIYLDLDNGYGARDGLEIYINGKLALEFLDGEPEDSNLRRDFNGVYSITNYLKLAVGQDGHTYEQYKVNSWGEYDKLLSKLSKEGKIK